MTITFTGLNSVMDRILFTNKGPIVKRPINLLTGSDLRIISDTEVIISSGNFNSSIIGKLLTISGSSGGRNDGSFYVKQVVSSIRLRLENANFDISDVAKTTSLVIGLANELKTKFNFHRIQVNVHGTNDTVHIVTASAAINLATSLTLLNDIKNKFNLHILDISGIPSVHRFSDPNDTVFFPDATNLVSAVLLANDLHRKYENHRQSRRSHLTADTVNRITVLEVVPIVNIFPGLLTGPFSWILKDTRPGLVADDPADVSVLINSLPASVDAVFGLLGAVVLSSKPAPTDTVSIDYDFLNNPPARLLRLGSPEFNLNQVGNLGYAGFPQHRYRSRSYLIDPGNSPDFMSAVQPQNIAWKYKAFEREYSAVLNDPNSLLLNVPTNRLTYPVLFQIFTEQTIRYDPITLPQNSTDPWELEGDGTFSLSTGGNELTIADSDSFTGPGSKPPFFTHKVDMRNASIVSAAFRMNIHESVNDGVFTGVSFGFSDGQKVAIFGFILTDATNLSSAMVMVNDAKSKFNAHIINIGSHEPNDSDDSIALVDATNLVQLIILVNEIKSKINTHMSKGGAGGIHVTSDIINSIVSPNAIDLDSAIILVNEIRSKLNTHEIELGIHFVDDTTNVINQVKQAGILTNRGFPEFQESWNCSSVDWTILRTYRVFIDSDGTASLFLSGDFVPIASVTSADLPSISDLDGKFDPIQQVFFGPIGRESTSTSNWAFIRVNINPIDSNLIGDNKKVDYEAVTTPEMDLQAPWITVGQGGTERISASILTIDSTSSAPSQSIQALGLSSGAYRGFLRFEPILSVSTTSSVEFSASLDFWTHSLDNKSAGIFIDDDNFSVQFCFLQFSPSPATVTGSASQLYPMVNSDQITLALDDDLPITIIFTSLDSTAASVAAKINLAAGATIASDSSGHIKLTSISVGVVASITIISGSALAKLGLSPGIYSGKDSNPEPRVSWFGENFPDLDDPTWLRLGSQSATLLNRTLRLTDSSTTDYIVYSLVDTTITNQAFNFSIDWKMDCRFTVLSFVAGDIVPAGVPYLALNFCGGLISVDEGLSGKNLELQIAVDGSNNPYLSLLSFNSGTGALDVKAQYVFNWKDGKVHSYDIYTSKNADSVFVLADGVLLSPIIGQPLPSYSVLNTGISGPSITFGSGSDSVTGSDMRMARSVIDWDSVAVFKDSKISDSLASSRRFVGIFKGGDSSLLSSYYLHQIDWTIPHTYRIIRDPVSAVSVFVDGGPIPVISMNYDVLTLPPVSSSFLKEITNSHQAIAFGNFDPQEISRSRWDFIRYSIGKLTLTDRLIPYGSVTNRANAVVSPDHLFTTGPHFHAGFSIYSGGTPIDDFLADSSIPAFTNLGEGTAPVPMTQNLESRGGLIRVVTPVESISSIDIVNTKGYISDYEDDIFNIITIDSATTVTSAISGLIAITNDLQPKYNTHLTQFGVHFLDDFINDSILPPAIDLPTSIALLNELKLRYNLHRVQAGIHIPDDLNNIIVSSDAIDLSTAIILADELLVKYDLHRSNAELHIIDDTTDIVTAPAAYDMITAAVLADDIRDQFIDHAPDLAFHLITDDISAVTVPYVSGLASGFVALDFITVTNYTIPLAVGDTIRFLTGPNTGLDRIVATLGVGDFTVSVPYPSPDVISSRFARIVAGQPILDASSVVALANSLKSRYNTHLILPGVHVSSDVAYTEVVPDAFDIPSAITLLNDLATQFNFHELGRLYHSAIDLVNIPAAPLVSDPFQTSIDLASDLLSKINSHMTQYRVHVTNDEDNLVLSLVPNDETSLIALSNKLKMNFNLHRISENVHIIDDSVNVVTSPDATDLNSTVILLNELKVRYEAHRTQANIHGSSVFIRLDPPDRVLYEGMKFFTNSTGESGHVSPFSDDETWHIDGFKAKQDQTLTYTGAALPENSQLVGDMVPPFLILGGETLMLKIDGGPIVTVIFQPGDVSAIAVIARINGTVGIPPLFASQEIDGRIRLISPTVGSPSQITIIGGSAVVILGLDVPQYTPWFIISDDPSAVDVSLMNAGPVDFMRYGTNASSRTVYKSNTGIPDGVSVRFEMTLSVRINHIFSPATNIDTGIYVGISGIAGPLGFTAGIGFEKLGLYRYVKVQDLNAGKTLFRRPFDWSDGNFHVYRLIRDVQKNVLQLAIDS